MCGIVAAASYRNIVPILLEGLRRLEYRGYDSCGVATVDNDGLHRARSVSRVAQLVEQVESNSLKQKLASLTLAGQRMEGLRFAMRIRFFRGTSSVWFITALLKILNRFVPDFSQKALSSPARLIRKYWRISSTIAMTAICWKL